MAGMLPGVEAARIRRFHQSNLGSAVTRRSSFCLYAAGHQEFRISSPSSVVGNPMSLGECDNENLEDVAREAKKRLDQRLRSYWKSEIKRKLKGQQRSTSVEKEAKFRWPFTK